MSSDVISRLEGNVPGLIFNKNALPSDNGTNINIQGHSTIFSNDQPLIVVDNFVYNGNINNLNPNEIESISILKDAAAASIWGAFSGNGVIVITTKKGKRGEQLKVDVNANVTVGLKPDLFQYNPTFLNSKDYIDIERQLFDLGYYDNFLYADYTYVSPVIKILADKKSGALDPVEADKQIAVLRNQDVRQDRENYLYRRSASQQYAVNFSGGEVEVIIFLH